MGIDDVETDDDKTDDSAPSAAERKLTTTTAQPFPRRDATRRGRE